VAVRFLAYESQSTVNRPFREAPRIALLPIHAIRLPNLRLKETIAKSNARRY
jgi:hypothetical protein